MPSSMPPGPAAPPITTVALKFEKTSVFLPATGKTTVADLKRAFVQAIQACGPSPSRPAVLAPDAFAIFQPRSPPAPSGQPVWLPLDDPTRSLADLKFQDAQALAVGFQNSNGSYDLPVVEIWREDNQTE